MSLHDLNQHDLINQHSDLSIQETHINQNNLKFNN